MRKAAIPELHWTVNQHSGITVDSGIGSRFWRAAQMAFPAIFGPSGAIPFQTYLGAYTTASWHSVVPVRGLMRKPSP